MPDYVLSSDGSVVYRLTPKGGVASTSLAAGLLTAFGYSVSTDTTGTITVNPYEAGWVEDRKSGGGHFEAVYNHGAPLAAGQTLEWVQVVTTNDPAGGRTSPYLDNANDSTYNPNASQKPFYTLTAQNSSSGPAQPSGSLYFFDFSKRAPGDVTSANPVNWSANLYPVIVDGQHITVENGETWGWTAKKATVGTVSATFTNPAPGNATVTGVGTANFTWGIGQPDVSSLSFAGGAFDATPGVKFKIGTLTYHNGTTASGSVATSVEFDAALNFTNVPEKNEVIKTVFGLNNSENTDDPVASADTVSIGSFGYTFNVQEGLTASVDVYATLSTGHTVSPAGASEDAAYETGDFDSNPDYTFNIVGLANPTAGGLVVLSGDDDDNVLTGTSDVDTIMGHGGADTIMGLEGDDVIYGGSGADVLTGGLGNDTFKGTAAEMMGDHITDLAVGDRISITDATLSDISYVRDGSTLTTNDDAVIDIGNPDARLVLAAGATGVDIIAVARMSGLADFNGDGHSDILWRNDSGAFTTWGVTGNVVGNQLHPNIYGNATVGTDWHIAETFDFNGDGHSDILWRNVTTGAFTVWEGTDDGFTPNVYGSASVSTGWQIATVADFNGDGRDDLVWRNTVNGALTIWSSTGTGLTPNTFASSAPTDWQIVGSGDFNGDGKADLLWRNQTTGKFVDWLSTGRDFVHDAYANATVDLGWHIKAIADFDGDGKADLLWRNSSSGAFTLWSANDTGGFTPNTYANATVGSGWQIAQTGDFNDDGKADILWRNTGTGAFTIWQSNGHGFDENVVANDSVGTSWHVQGHDYLYG
jgi:hypothetical protein